MGAERSLFFIYSSTIYAFFTTAWQPHNPQFFIFTSMKTSWWKTAPISPRVTHLTRGFLSSMWNCRSPQLATINSCLNGLCQTCSAGWWLCGEGTWDRTPKGGVFPKSTGGQESICVFGMGRGPRGVHQAPLLQVSVGRMTPVGGGALQ